MRFILAMPICSVISIFLTVYGILCWLCTVYYGDCVVYIMMTVYCTIWWLRTVHYVDGVLHIPNDVGKVCFVHRRQVQTSRIALGACLLRHITLNLPTMTQKPLARGPAATPTHTLRVTTTQPSPSIMGKMSQSSREALRLNFSQRITQTRRNKVKSPSYRQCTV